MLYVVGMVMGFAFLLQLWLHGGAMFAIQWWPVFVTGFLFAATCCLKPQFPQELMPSLQRRRQFYFMQKLPGNFTLKCSALFSFGLSPFWCWQSSPATLSYRLTQYFIIMLVVAAIAMFVMMLAFAIQLRALAVCIGGSDGLVQRLNLTVCGWIYLFMVPVCAVIVGSWRQWQNVFTQEKISLGLFIQLFEFQVFTVCFSWIGTILAWVVLALLLWEVVTAFELLFSWNRFLMCKVQNEALPAFMDSATASSAPKEETFLQTSGEGATSPIQPTNPHPQENHE